MCLLKVWCDQAGFHAVPQPCERKGCQCPVRDDFILIVVTHAIKYVKWTLLPLLLLLRILGLREISDLFKVAQLVDNRARTDSQGFQDKSWVFHMCPLTLFISIKIYTEHLLCAKPCSLDTQQ